MRWSWKVGKLAGIDVRIHATFWLLLGWVGLSYWTAGKGADSMLAGVVFIIALFACILLHELGHAMMARNFGIQAGDITLLPIGGLARLERMPEEPRQELWIALAGPAVNIAIAAVLYGWLNLKHEWEPLSRLRVATGPFIERLLVANLSLVLFNLIPAFPMDGGRVLRALLASRMTYAKATRTAAWIGRGVGVVFGFFGLFASPMLLFVGLFVWIAARQEAGAAQTRSALSDIPARAAMSTEFEALQSGATLDDAVDLILRGSQHDFPVIEQGRAIGIVTRSDLIVALAEHNRQDPVAFVMRREFPIVEAADGLDIAFQRLQESARETILVVQEGHLVGMITMANLHEYLLIEAILQKRGGSFRFMNRAFWRERETKINRIEAKN
jgi:Zn-dependent protease/predicted transcriptional regulator